VEEGKPSCYYLGGGGGTLNIDVTLLDFTNHPDYGGIGPTWLEMGTTGQLLPGRVVLNYPTTYTGRTDIRAGTLEPNDFLSLYCTSQLNVRTTCTAFDGAFHNVVSPFSFAGPGQLLLQPGMIFMRSTGSPIKPQLYGGAVGWTGDKTLDSLDDVGEYAGTLSVSMDPSQCNEQDTYLLHLGGEYSEGTMTVAPTFVITDNVATPVALVKSGTGSILDLTACPMNTYTGGTAIIGGKVIVSEPNQVGTGPILVANGGRLHVTESGTYGNTLRFITEGTPSQLMCNGSVVEVDESRTATFTGRVKVRHRLQGGVSGSVETVFEKLGQGTMFLDYRENGQPAAYPSDLNNVWGVKLTEGLLSTNQLCFLEDARTGGYLVCLGGDMEVRPTPVPLENYKDGWQDYGFAGFVSFKDTVSKITVQDGNDALFRVCNWIVPNEIMGTVIFDVPEGDTDGSNNRFHLRCGHVDNFLQYQARGTGTLDVRGGMVLLTSDAGVRVLPQEAGFTIKLNGGRFNGIPEADLNGNLIINDLDAGGTAQVDGAEAQWDWDGPLSPTVWTIGGTGTTSWGGTLEKVGDGQVMFARCLGTPVSVDPAGATLQITSGTVEAGGSADPFTDTSDPTRHVDVVNNSMFVVSSGTKEVGHLVGNGQLDVNPNAHLFNNNNSPAIEQAVVNVLGQLTIREYTGPGGDYDASRIETLVVDPNGRFNLTNNALVIGTGSRNAVRNLIVSGYNSGAWGGLGICTDSTVPGNSVGLGYAAGNDPALDPLAWQFHGQGFDADSVLVLFTVLGDADLDGDVDGPDVARWAVNFTGDLGGGSLPSRYWTQGDWDYDGDVDADDVNQWASNFEGDLTQLVVDAPGAPPEAVSTLGDMGVTVVPEPATLSLLALGALAVIRRKRQNVACCWSH
jgi:hypothetical protein